jgi:hypothetical protein
MKQLKCLLILMFFPGVTFSQKQLRGIGDLIIGETRIDTLEKLTRLEMHKLFNNDVNYYTSYHYNGDNMNSSPILFEIILPKEKDDSYVNIFPESYFMHEYRFVGIKFLDIGGIDMENMQLMFKNDTLFRIQADYNKDIPKALEANYGAPVRSSTQDTIQCTYKLTGHTENLEEKTIMEKWKNKNIVATTHFRKYYDNHCKEKFLTFFDIEDSDKFVELMERSQGNTEKMDNDQKLKDKEKYKKF